MEYPKVCKKISGRSQAKYMGLELRALQIEVLDALDSLDMDYDEAAPSPCDFNDESSLSSYQIVKVTKQNRRNRRFGVNLHELNMQRKHEIGQKKQE